MLRVQGAFKPTNVESDGGKRSEWKWERGRRRRERERDWMSTVFFKYVGHSINTWILVLPYMFKFWGSLCAYVPKCPQDVLHSDRIKHNTLSASTLPVLPWPSTVYYILFQPKAISWTVFFLHTNFAHRPNTIRHMYYTSAVGFASSVAFREFQKYWLFKVATSCLNVWSEVLLVSVGSWLPSSG